MGKKRTIDSFFKNEQIENNRTLMKISIATVRLMAFNGWPFEVQDPEFDTTNRGIFLDWLDMVGSFNENVMNAINKAPISASHTSPEFPKEILRFYATKVKSAIRNEIGDAKFCVIVDETRVKYEDLRIALVLRFVDKDGLVQERFLGTVEFPDYAGPSSLKSEIYSVLSHYGLDFQNIRGQGCFGTVYMRDDFHELQASVMSDCPHAYYIHCFTHCLQQALVAASQQNIHDYYARPFFSNLTEVGIRARVSRLSGRTNEKLKTVGETLEHAGDTRWSSHLKALTTLLDMYDDICTQFEKVIKEESPSSGRVSVELSYNELASFEFVFVLCLMKEILEITDVLCQALQCRSKDFTDLVELISKTKSHLQQLRAEKWSDLLASVRVFCEKADVNVPDFGARYVAERGLPPPQHEDFTVEDHYRFDIFYSVIDSQLQELNHRFSENAIELLILTSALNPQDASEIYKIDDICRLVNKLYPQDFTDDEKMQLKMEIPQFELNVVKHSEYKNLSNLCELCHWLVKTKRSETYPLVYRVITLVVTLPVFTAATERSFSAFDTVKSRLREGMSGDVISESLLLYIEREVAETFSDIAIMDAYREAKQHPFPF